MTETSPRKSKRKIILGILGAIAILIVAFVIVVSMQPSHFKVTRSLEISAPPEIVFEQINDFHKWNAWSPWAKMDPNAKYSFEGPTSGTGAIFRWNGNSDIGEGNMTITESKPNESINIKLEFIKPMPGVSPTVFTFKPDNGNTVVTWTMTGESNFISKAVCMFMNMDKMVGGQFEEGLQSIKKISEAASKQQ